ncbi:MULTISPECIES: hypothetical protein [unclassified Roseovarius]|uniref:alginate O-acetyltransferase AlgX-related protein n=1 Tax=unclassified Roseovarius TaxID=2614913 RepID=UPI00273E5420|nr:MULTISPECIES: hypothetical protein [unclassified Roseovarius]
MADRVRNLLTALTFLMLIAVPMLIHLARQAPVDAGAENRSLAATPSLAGIRADWTAFPETVNAWMRDHFGLRRSYLKIGFELEKVLPSSADFKAVRGDDGWIFNTLNAALALHRGLLPFSAGEADAWLDGLELIEARAEASGAVFIAAVAPNKHSIYPEYLSNYPRQVAGETRLDEVQRRARDRDLPLIDLRPALRAAKSDTKVYYQTDSHWTDLGAYTGFVDLRRALVERGIDVPDIPRDALRLREVTDFQGDLYGLLGEENGPPESITAVRPPHARGAKAGSILLIGDSFITQIAKYFEGTFEKVDIIDNAAGAPDLSKITPGTYDVVLFEIVERYLSRPLEPISGP